MELTGESYIGARRTASGTKKFQAVNPATGTSIPPEFHEATPVEIDEAVSLAEKAFLVYRRKSGKERAVFLRKTGEAIEAVGDELIRRCMQETGLPEARLKGERARTIGQLNLFADLLDEGSWVDARIDMAMPERQPVPKPDVRSMLIALGPVGVFGASNFPMAFSVAGGDTASALAAGCTVVCKAHQSHPGTSELMAGALIQAARETGMPDGVFSMVQGESPEVGLAMVRHPAIQAIGFTGSFRGGKALFNEACNRAVPIPVFAEMGSINPVFVLPEAQATRSEELSNMISSSVTLGVGQFCTNPGVIVTASGPAKEEFENLVANRIGATPVSSMLSPGIKKNYDSQYARISSEPGVEVLTSSSNSGAQTAGVAHVLRADGRAFIGNESLRQEIFGPSTIIVRAESREELIAIAEALEGQLTATLIGTANELPGYQPLIDILERKAGRLIINGLPTGVEVCHAMVHGGPYPATTDSRSTSVGTAAILRFSRAVCYQGFPQDLLPDELRDANPLSIWRTIDGRRSKS